MCNNSALTTSIKSKRRLNKSSHLKSKVLTSSPKVLTFNLKVLTFSPKVITRNKNLRTTSNTYSTHRTNKTKEPLKQQQRTNGADGSHKQLRTARSGPTALIMCFWWRSPSENKLSSQLNLRALIVFYGIL